LNAVADWIARYRDVRGFRNDMMNCSADDVAGIARELRISGELAEIAKKGPHAADLLEKLLIALGVDADGLAHDRYLPRLLPERARRAHQDSIDA
jgi:hypothetical protein